MIRLTRRYRFAASHRLHSPALSEEANQELYGKCNNPYGHGHDYILEITARGPVDQESGLLMNVAALDGLVERRVLDEFRMSYLNDSASFAGARVPTTENLVEEIRARLGDGWGETFSAPWPVLEKVRIRETRKNTFETMVSHS